MRHSFKITFSLITLVLMGGFAEASDIHITQDNWVSTMLDARAKVQKQDPDSIIDLSKLWLSIQQDFPIETDWLNQDLGITVCEQWFQDDGKTDSEERAITTALKGLKDSTSFEERFQSLRKDKAEPSDARWLTLYAEIAQARRAQRLQPLQKAWPTIVFTKHHSFGGSHYAYTEDLSDSAYPERERHNPDYRMGASLCLLQINPDGTSSVESLLESPDGIIRDPDVSYDGKRILFSKRNSNTDDDFHLYEMDIASREVRQLTDGLGYADYESVYLPNGDILFNSTRCVQIVDCWWTDVSNLYTCNADGQQIRRTSFDQVHTNYPTVMEDGRVIYTRWDYNDRGQLFPQPLFQMNPDSTGQTEFYGNNAWFPTTILHARGIPGTEKVLAVISGHHSHQRGKLGILDPAKGRQEADGVQLIAPVRETTPERIDAYGQDGAQFQYPYPLSEREFLVTFSPYGGNRNYPKPFAIYFMDIDGNRELLVSDPNISCNQPVPLVSRELPHHRPSQVDYAKDEGTYYLQDIYTGLGLKDVARGEIEKLRVVALDFRAAGIGYNQNRGEAGGALVSTPISIGNGAWDPKIVLGEAKVHEDGSALFKVPARTPLYFQAIDKQGRVAQTMRSWSTLQPGEMSSCVGCHEDKNQAPPTAYVKTMATQQEPQALTPFQNVEGGFSFPKYIQPILNKNCVQCHNNREALFTRISGETPSEQKSSTALNVFSLMADTNEDTSAKRLWSDAYLALTNSQPRKKEFPLTNMAGHSNELVNWLSTQSRPDALPSYHAGSGKSNLLTLLADGHGETNLSREELALIACWIDLGVPYCADYTEAAAWSDKEKSLYKQALKKRTRMQEMDRNSIESMRAENK